MIQLWMNHKKTTMFQDLAAIVIIVTNLLHKLMVLSQP